MYFNVTQIREGKVEGTWTHFSTISEAIALVEVLRVSGPGSTFSIENSHGTVEEVIRWSGCKRAA